MMMMMMAMAMATAMAMAMAMMMMVGDGDGDMMVVLMTMTMTMMTMTATTMMMMMMTMLRLLNGDGYCPVVRLFRCIHEARVNGLLDETEAQCLRGKLSAVKDGLGGCLSVEKGVCR